MLLVYGAWLIAFFGSGHDPRDMIYIGTRFINQSHVSQVIRLDPSYHNVGETGYDGEFFYYLALDPINAHAYMDFSTYRYTRVLYPMLARLLALGQPGLIPITLFLINWLAIAGGTLAVAAWLKRSGHSPWFGLVYGFYPGLDLALQRDLSEALAYGLVAAAVYVFDFGPGAGSKKIWLSAGIFALAALARETTAIFPLVYGVVLLQGAGNWRRPIRVDWLRAVFFVALALGPLALYKLLLLLWLGAGHDVGIPLAHLPFQGLWHWHYWEPASQMDEIWSVVIPALIAAAVGLYALYRRVVRPELLLLLLNVLIFVVFLQADAYIEVQASSRVTTGVVLAALLCLPALTAVAPRRAWFWVCSTLWLLLVPFWLIIPVARYGFHVLRLLKG